jgi:hypothetical protein
VAKAHPKLHRDKVMSPAASWGCRVKGLGKGSGGPSLSGEREPGVDLWRRRRWEEADRAVGMSPV